MTAFPVDHVAPAPRGPQRTGAARAGGPGADALPGRGGPDARGPGPRGHARDVERGRRAVGVAGALRRARGRYAGAVPLDARRARAQRPPRPARQPRDRSGRRQRAIRWTAGASRSPDTGRESRPARESTPLAPPTAEALPRLGPVRRLRRLHLLRAARRARALGRLARAGWTRRTSAAYHAAEPDPVAGGAADAVAPPQRGPRRRAALDGSARSAATRTRPRPTCARADRYGLDLSVLARRAGSPRRGSRSRRRRASPATSAGPPWSSLAGRALLLLPLEASRSSSGSSSASSDR